MRIRADDRIPLFLLGVWAVFSVVMGIDPHYREDWALETILPVVAVVILAYSYRGFRFTDLAYAALFVFLMIHTIGAHYTYAEVPLGFRMAEWFDWERNHFDRIVHFLYGLLLSPMAVELVDRLATIRSRAWGYTIIVMFLGAHSALYEIIEWWAAELVGGDLGAAYLGTQGDEWDAQKDMGLGFLGAAVGVGLLLLRREDPQ